MSVKFYKVQGRYSRLKFFHKGQEVIIQFRATPVEDEELQEKIERSRDFGRNIILCDPPGESPPEEVEEVDKSRDPDDGRLSFGLNELKSMHVAKLRGIAQRASVWQKGMTRADMIEALIGG
jgi:hypothetical protein